MKTIYSISTVVLIMTILFMAITGFSYAQEVLEVTTQQITDEKFIQLLIESLGGLKGAGALGVAVIITKLIIALLDAPFFGKVFSGLSSAIKLITASVLAYVSGVLGLVSTGLPVGVALVHSSVVPLLVAFFHLVYKHFFEKKTKEELLEKAKAIADKAKKL